MKTCADKHATKGKAAKCDTSACAECKEKGCTPENCKCAAGCKGCPLTEKAKSAATTPAAETLTRTTAATTGGTGYQVNITGMTCGACAEKLTKALSTMPGLEANSVQVDVSGQKAFLVIKKGTTADVKALVTAKIKEAGYTVTEVTTLN